MDMFKTQKELEKGELGPDTPVTSPDTTPTRTQNPLPEEVPTTIDDTMVETFTDKELLQEIAKNTIAIMKEIPKIKFKVEEFRTAWSKNQKAGKF